MNLCNKGAFASHSKSKDRIITILVVCIALFLGLGIGDRHNLSEDKIVSKDTVITGKDLYRLNCAVCHGINKTGLPKKFPSLEKINDKMSKKQMLDYIKNGNRVMHNALSNLPDNEINAILSFLCDEPDAQTLTQVANNSFADLGKKIVMSNCLCCHRLTANDSLPPDAKTLCPLKEPAALSGENDPYKFYLILKTGPCSMPSFDFLTPNEKNAVWMYLRN